MFRTVLVLFLASLVVTGCSQTGPAKDKVYDIRGKITAIDPAKPGVTLDHEDIPGYMKAMEMPFDVDNASVLEGLQKGDAVQGKLKVQSGKKDVITELKKR